MSVSDGLYETLLTVLQELIIMLYHDLELDTLTTTKIIIDHFSDTDTYSETLFV